MAQNMKVIGEKVWLKVEEPSITLIEICTQENSTKIEQMGTEPTSTKTAKDTKENGRMICNTVKVLKSLRMDLSMKVNSETAKSKDMEFMNGPTVQNIKAIGLKIISMVKENTPGQMVESIRVNGRTICSMEKASTHGQMEENMKENTKMIKKTEKVSTPGQMARSTMVDGKIASNMERPRLQILKGRAKEVFGRMEIERNGLVQLETPVNQTYDVTVPRDIYL